MNRHFKSNSVVNHHNMHYWSTENPRWVRYVDRQSVWSINVWGGIIGHHVIGPHFLNGNLMEKCISIFYRMSFETC
jgi:hypothetical protein